MLGDWLLPRFNIRFVGGVTGLAVDAAIGSIVLLLILRSVGAALARPTRRRLSAMKREFGRLAWGSRSEVRQTYADEPDASLWGEDRPDQVECDFP
jgi:hypothetical protein